MVPDYENGKSFHINILSKLRHTPTSYQVSFFMIMDNGMDAEVRYNISHLILILN